MKRFAYRSRYRGSSAREVLAGIFLCMISSSASADIQFRRGDVNVDGRLDVSDPISTLIFLFTEASVPPGCEKAADADDDGQIAINDPVFLLLHLFAGGKAPPPPFAECGSDLTSDALPCERFEACRQADETGLFRARVISQVVWPLEEGELSGFTPGEIESMRRDGVEVSETEVRSPALPLSGKYLEVNGNRYMLSRDGYVTLPDAQGLTAVKVFWQVTDDVPVAVIGVLKAAPAGEVTPETFLELTYRPPADMNGGLPGGGGSPGGGAACSLPTSSDGCPLRTLGPGCPGTNASPCCEDYLGPLGDGQPRWRHTNPFYPECPVDGVCAARAYRNFVESICYQWVFRRRGRPCLSETVGIAPACWERHKYRNCQNMDEDEFTLQASPAPVKFGEKVRLTILNNTAANSTMLRIEPASGKGDLKLAPGAPPATLVPDGAGWRLEHWNDGRKEHYEGVSLDYQTPDRDSTGKCVANYTIYATADGLEKKVTVRVLPKKNAWSGTTKRTSISDILGLHNEVTVTAQVLFDIDAGTVSGTATFTETQTAVGCVLSGTESTPIVPRADTYLRVDFVPDPPKMEGEGSSDFFVTLEMVCPGGSTSTSAQFDHEGWFSTMLGGRQFYTSSDGCHCKDVNDTGVFGSSHIIYEWDLTKLPDP